jgi:signal transduction histidine kinase
MRKDGSRVSVYSSHAIVHTLGGVPELFCIDIDLTDRKQAEEALKENEARLRELNATKDKFFSIISHDLKNPFNSILGLSNLLVEQIQEKNYEGIEEYAEIIQKSSIRVFDLLVNLLEWSRFQTGRMEFSPEYVEMVSLINEVTELFDDSVRLKSITIFKELPRNMLIFADKAMISTILRNLISNAIKFTHPQGQITISAESKKDKVEIAISDNGVGIKNENVEKLFRIAENQTTLGTKNERGTGLGLILCKEFIEKHGGKIWVESEAGKGSKFYFTIPKT